VEPTDLIKTLRKAWAFVLFGMLLGGSAGFGAASIATPEYKATTKLFVAVQTAGATSATDVSQGSAAAQQKVRSYADIVTTGSILDPVIDELHLRTTTSALARRVQASINSNTVVVAIEVTAESGQQAAAIANAIGRSFVRVVESLEKPTADTASLVRAATVQEAIAPTAPSSPNTTLNIAVGLALGAFLGFGAALLRSVLDTRIHTAREVADVTPTPVLATLGYDPDVKKQPLIVSGDPRNPLAEAYRTLRSNLQFVNLASGNGSFVVTSAMPSEGKTTSTANLAIALAETGARVALVDADLRRPRVADIMGLENAAGLTDLLIGRAEMDDVVHRWGRLQLDVLPAGQVPPNPSELLGSAAMRTLLDLLSEQYDYVLLDAPPLLPVTDAAVLATMAAGAVVVTAAKRSRTTQLRVALERLDRVGASVLGIVVNMAPFRSRGGYGGVYEGSYGSYYGRVEPVELSTTTTTTTTTTKRGRRLRDTGTRSDDLAPASGKEDPR